MTKACFLYLFIYLFFFWHFKDNARLFQYIMDMQLQKRNQEMETGTMSSEDAVEHNGVYIWSLYLREQAQGRTQL